MAWFNIEPLFRILDELCNPPSWNACDSIQRSGDYKSLLFYNRVAYAHSFFNVKYVWSIEMSDTTQDLDKLP